VFMVYLKAVSTDYCVITSVRVVLKDIELERSGRKLSWSDFEAIYLDGTRNNFSKHIQSRR